MKFPYPKYFYIHGVEWSRDDIKAWIVEEFGFYYGGRISKSSISNVFSPLISNDNECGFTYFIFYLKTPRSQKYNGSLKIRYRVCFDTGIFTRLDD